LPKKGKQPTVKTTGKRKGLKIFGAIEFKTGAFKYVECNGKFNGEFYAECLKHILGLLSCFIVQEQGELSQGAITEMIWTC